MRVNKESGRAGLIAACVLGASACAGARATAAVEACSRGLRSPESGQAFADALFTGECAEELDECLDRATVAGCARARYLGLGWLAPDGEIPSPLELSLGFLACSRDDECQFVSPYSELGARAKYLKVGELINVTRLVEYQQLVAAHHGVLPATERWRSFGRCLTYCGPARGLCWKGMCVPDQDSVGCD